MRRFAFRLLPFAVGPLDFTPIVAIIAVGAAAEIVTAILDHV